MLLNISRIFMWDTSMHEAVKTRHSTQCEAILTVLKIQSSLGSEENEWRMNEKMSIKYIVKYKGVLGVRIPVTVILNLECL